MKIVKSFQQHRFGCSSCHMVDKRWQNKRTERQQSTAVLYDYLFSQTPTKHFGFTSCRLFSPLFSSAVSQWFINLQLANKIQWTFFCIFRWWLEICIAPIIKKTNLSGGSYSFRTASAPKTGAIKMKNIDNQKEEEHHVVQKHQQQIERNPTFSYVFFCLSFGGEAIQEKKTFSSRRNDNRTIA